GRAPVTALFSTQARVGLPGAPLTDALAVGHPRHVVPDPLFGGRLRVLNQIRASDELGRGKKAVVVLREEVVSLVVESLTDDPHQRNPSSRVSLVAPALLPLTQHPRMNVPDRVPQVAVA